MTDDLAKARHLKEMKKKFGDPKKLSLTVDEGIADLWEKCAMCWEGDDDVKDLAIFGKMLDTLITLAEFRLIQDQEIIAELDAAKSLIADKPATPSD